MLYGLVLVIHILLSLFLIVIVLLQGGRGGMGDALSGAAAQSIFGGGANTVMTKLTAVVASLFMVTCLSLAFLSTRREGPSVVDQLPLTEESLPSALPLPEVPEDASVSSGQTPEPSPSTTTTPP